LQGIGLFKNRIFIWGKQSLPSEDEQFAISQIRCSNETLPLLLEL
jgi:phosphoenolpyruvate-protein kinase (PTS system EI component)